LGILLKEIEVGLTGFLFFPDVIMCLELSVAIIACLNEKIDEVFFCHDAKQRN
jgi:hypothetical protein